MKKNTMAFFLALLLLLTGCARGDAVYLESAGTTEVPCVTDVPENAGISTEADTPGDVEDFKVQEADTEAALCYVYICGAVVTPGVYVLPEGSRIYEAVEMAGGLAADAADSVNLAQNISDGQMIRIPTAEEISAVADEVPGAGEISGGDGRSGTEAALEEGGLDDGRVNINTASASELMTLAGIGESKADSIIAYRTEHGGFASVEELMNVEGIKEGVFNRIKDNIKVK